MILKILRKVIDNNGDVEDFITETNNAELEKYADMFRDNKNKNIVSFDVQEIPKDDDEFNKAVIEFKKKLKDIREKY